MFVYLFVCLFVFGSPGSLQETGQWLLVNSMVGLPGSLCICSLCTCLLGCKMGCKNPRRTDCGEVSTRQFT